MPTAKTVWTLIYTDDKHDPVVEDFDIFAALKAKMRQRGIEGPDPRYRLLVNGRPVTFHWGEPELYIGENAAAAKPRKPRRSRAEIEAEDKAKAEARAKAKANGAGAVVTS